MCKRQKTSYLFIRMPLRMTSRLMILTYMLEAFFFFFCFDDSMGLAFHDLNIEDSTFYGSYILFDVFLVNI